MGCASSAPHEPQQHVPQRTTTRRPREQTQRTPGSLAVVALGWDKDFPALTNSQLATKRSEFWDTHSSGAYGGRPELWAALRLACEALQTSQDDTAIAILESASLQPLDSEQADQAFTYDERGFKYCIPFYCVFNPSNLLRDPPPVAAATSVAAAAAHNKSQPLQVQVAPLSARGNGGVAAPAAESKSPDAVVAGASGKLVQFKVRFSNGLPDLAVQQPVGVNLAQVKALITTQHPSLPPERVRLYYLGKLMASNSWTLGDIGMRKEMVLQCFVPRGKE